VRRHTAAAFRAIEVARSNPTEEKRRENRAMLRHRSKKRKRHGTITGNTSSNTELLPASDES